MFCLLGLLARSIQRNESLKKKRKTTRESLGFGSFFSIGGGGLVVKTDLSIQQSIMQRTKSRISTIRRPNDDTENGIDNNNNNDDDDNEKGSKYRKEKQMTMLRWVVCLFLVCIIFLWQSSNHQHYHSKTRQIITHHIRVGDDPAATMQKRDVVLSPEQVKTIDLKTCIRRNDENQCVPYPCYQKDYNWLSVTSSAIDEPYGYSGRFVQHVTSHAMNKKRILPTVGGGKKWDSGCAVSHKYKFIYIHVLKSGGSAIKTFIRRSFCGEEDPECESIDPQIIKPEKCRTILNAYPKYFVFSFVRNPFSRIYSMYSMTAGYPPVKRKVRNEKNVISKLLIQGHPLEEGKDEFLKPRQDLPHYDRPGGLKDLRNGGRHLQEIVDTYNFTDFVMNPSERKFHTSMSASHYIQQTSFLFDKHNCPSFDFLGRVEYFDQDMKVILDHLKVPEMNEYFKTSGNTVKPVNTWGSNNKKNSLGGDLRNIYKSQDVVDRVVHTYENDFRLLGYNTSTIPG